MARFVPIVAAFAGAAVAQETVLDLMVFSNDIPLVGSVVKVEASITTVLVGCPAEITGDSCPFGTNHLTIAQGPSTFGLLYTSMPPESDYPLSSSLDCKLDGTVASCIVDVSQGPATEKSDYVDNNYSTLIHPVPITAGAEKLTAATTSPRPTADDKSDELPSPKPTESVTKPPSTSISTSTKAAGNGTISSTTSKAGAPAMTQHAVLAGMAAIVGGVLAF